MFTKQQLVDKITTSDIWLDRSLKKIIQEQLVLDEDIEWFVEIDKRISNGGSIPSIVRDVIRLKITTNYIDDLLELANGG